MVRSRSVALTALLVVGATSLARAQAAGGSAAGADPTLTAGVDTSALARDRAMEDSARAIVAQDDSQTQTDQARLDSVQDLLRSDRTTTPRATAAVSRDQAAVSATQKALRRDAKQAKHARSQLGSIEKAVKKEQGLTKKLPASPRPAPSAH
jgi:hypothetical protein